MAEAEIGVIGITAASSPLDEATEQVVETPYGATSAPVALGDVGGRRVAFLARRGNAGEIPPHRIPYRANVWALKELGVRRIVAPVVCGALTLEYDLGDMVVCDQFVDRTWGRDDTYYDGPGTVLVASARPFCDDLGAVSCLAHDLGLRVFDRATTVVVQGPRFSTTAESLFHRAMGWDLVNMVSYPESHLARELELCYANLSIVTDHDIGIDGVGGVTSETVTRVMAESMERLDASPAGGHPRDRAPAGGRLRHGARAGQAVGHGARRRIALGTCCSTTHRSRATATRFGSCSLTSGSRTSGATSTSSIARTGGGARRAQPRPARADARARRRPAARRVGRDPLVLRRGTPLRPERPLRAGEGSPVDVLRAVHARAGDRGRPLPRRLLRRGGAARGADRAEDRRRVPRARRDGAAPRRRDALPRRRGASRSPTSRSTRTPTSRTRAASTSPATRRSARGSTAWRPSRGTCRSTHERPRPLRAEPDRLAPPRQRADRRREPPFADRTAARSSCGSTTPTRRGSSPGGEEAILRDLEWLGILWDEGPVRQSERASLRAAAADARSRRRRVRDADGSLRLGGIDPAARRRHGDLPARFRRRRPRARDHARHPGIRSPSERGRCSAASRARSARELPEVIHHGLLLGDGRQEALQAARPRIGRRPPRGGHPAGAVRAYLEELGLPAHDVQLDLARIGRLAVDAIAAMPDEELAAAAGAPLELARALRGARTLVEAREIARQILEPDPVRSATRRGRRSSASSSSAPARRSARRGGARGRSCAS